MSLDYRDRTGRNITELEYHVLKDLDGYATLGDFTLGDYHVKTEWNGYTTMLFTTYVFKKDRSFRSAFDRMPSQRYETEDAALAGHERAVNLIRAIYGRGDANDPNMIDRVHAAIRGDKDDPISWAKARKSRSLF